MGLRKDERYVQMNLCKLQGLPECEVIVDRLIARSEIGLHMASHKLLEATDSNIRVTECPERRLAKAQTK